MRFQRRSALLLAIGLAMGAIGTAAPPVSAATDQLRTKAVTTYDPQPARGVVHVTQVITLTNKAPSTSRSRSCTQTAFDPYYGYYTYQTTCTTRTDYYYDAYEIWVERDATAIKAKASTGSAKVKPGKRDGDWRKVRIAFAPLYYGRTRTLTVSYDLPAGGPRATTERRTGAAYLDFCVAGPGTDVGTVRVRVPAGFTLAVTKSMKDSVSGTTRTYTSGAIKEPWKFFSCLRGANESGYDKTQVTAPGGETVAVEAWHDDPAWSDAVHGALTGDLPAMREVLGGDGGPLPAIQTVRESESSASAADWYNPVDGTLRISETTATRPEMTHRLGMTLFDGMFLVDWLTHGYASWTAHEAGVSAEPCDPPGTYPGTGTASLASWVDATGSTDETKVAVAAWQRQAACSIVATLGDAIGPDLMRDTIERLRKAEPAYPTADAVAASDAVTASETGSGARSLGWHEWIDLVTERGLVPAGADPAILTDALVTYGIARDDRPIEARASALQAYHALLAMTGRLAPTAVTEGMSAWTFDEATAAIAAATATWQTTEQVAALVPDAAIEDGSVRSAMQSADTTEDLDSARALAEKQLTLARSVADTQALAAAPMGVVGQVGLIGTTLPAASIGVDAVSQIDETAATGYAADVRTAIASAETAGTQRIALGGGLLALLLAGLAAAFIVRRRRHRPADAVAMPASAAETIDPEDQPPA